MKKIAAIALVALLSACTDPDTARHALENYGFTDIQIGGYAFYGCSKGDNFATKFTATNPQGKQVSGIVCSGLLKGATIRF